MQIIIKKSKMTKAAIVFPHQLFEQIPFSRDCEQLFLVEEALFFKQYPFHKQKLAFNRASMKFYEEYLSNSGKKVTYVEAHQEEADVGTLISNMAEKGLVSLEIIDVADNWLEKEYTWQQKRQV